MESKLDEIYPERNIKLKTKELIKYAIIKHRIKNKTSQK